MLLSNVTRPRVTSWALVFTVWLPLVGCRSRTSDLQEQAGGAAAFFERINPDRLQRIMVDQVARQNIRTKLSVFRLNFADFAGLGGRYDYAVSRTEGGELRRVDRWVLSSSVTPGTLLVNAAGQSLPVLIHLEAGREIEFSRVYNTHAEALAARPRTILDAPLSLDATRGLKEGEIVSLPIRMGFRLGAQQAVMSGPLGTRAAGGVFWAGESRLVIMRLDDRRVRVKAMPQESRGLFLHAQMGISLDMFGYGPFGLIDMDRQAERALGLDLFRLNREITVDADRLAIDYVINLADPTGARVYETLVARPLRLTAQAMRELVLPGPVAQAVMDLGPAEAIHMEDRELHPEDRRVTRVFQGANAWLGDATSARLGTRFWRGRTGKSLTINWLTTAAEDGTLSRAVYHVFHQNRKVSSLFSQLREEDQFSAASVLLASRDWRELRFLGFNMDWRLGERRLTPQDASDHMGMLKAVLGDWGQSLDYGVVTPPRGAAKYSLTMRISYPDRLLRAMRELAERDPDQYEKHLWLALWAIVPQLEGRFGAYSPGEPVNIRAEMDHLLRRTTQSLRQLTRNAINLRWEGVRGSTGQDLIEASLRLATTHPFDWSADILNLLERDESAREIAPAYLLALCRLFAVEPHISVDVSREGSASENFSLGEFSHRDVHERVEQSLSEIRSAGFER